jgi:hypothetical protein
MRIWQGASSTAGRELPPRGDKPSSRPVVPGAGVRHWWSDLPATYGNQNLTLPATRTAKISSKRHFRAFHSNRKSLFSMIRQSQNSRQHDNDRTGRKTSVLRQVEQIRPDLMRPEMFRRFTKIRSEPDDLFNIHTLRMRCQVTDLHVLNHAATKRAYGQLLFEMDSATWRQRIVSRLSCQTRGRRRTVATNRPYGDKETKPKSQYYGEAV